MISLRIIPSNVPTNPIMKKSRAKTAIKPIIEIATVRKNQTL